MQSSSTLLYKTLLSEVKGSNQSTIPVHLQSKSTDKDELVVQSVMKMLNGSERRSIKFEKKTFDVSKVKTLTEDIPKKFSVGYWRRWYDDLTLLEDISLKEDKKQAENLTTIMFKKLKANKSRQLGRRRVPPLVPVSACQKSISDGDRKNIMNFLGISEKYVKPEVKKVSTRRKRRDNDVSENDDRSVDKDVGNTTDMETPILSKIKEVDEDTGSDDTDASDSDVDVEDAMGITPREESSSSMNMESTLTLEDSLESSSPLHDAAMIGAGISTPSPSPSCVVGEETSTRHEVGTDRLAKGQATSMNDTSDSDNHDDNDNSTPREDNYDTFDGAYNYPSAQQSESSITTMKSSTSLNKLENYTMGALAGFGFGCSRQEHVLYGMCQDKNCCKRALWEQTAITLKDLGRIRGKKSTVTRPSRLVEAATGLVSEPRDYISPLHVAVFNCDVVSIQLLRHVKDKVNDIVKPYELRQTLLHTAVLKRQLRVTETLIDCFRAYINMDSVDQNGDTPLHISSRNGDYNIVVLLCDSGANVLIKNKVNKYPIELAKSHAIYQILKVEGDRQQLESELNQLKQKMLNMNSGAGVHVDSDQEMKESTEDQKLKSPPSFVFKTEKFKRTYARKKGLQLSLSTDKKLDNPANHSFMIGYWKEDNNHL